MSLFTSTEIAPDLVMFPDAARAYYQLETRDASHASTELEASLIARSVGRVAMPITHGDFKRVIASFEACIEEVPDLLAATTGIVDYRRGSDVGYVRKELKIEDGKQTADPKSLFHFNELARAQWRDVFAHAPAVMRTFLREGEELHDELTEISREAIGELESTHPNIVAGHFPSGEIEHQSFSFLRIISYDGYIATEDMPDVAKAHNDISHFTIQAYADAAGFWGARSKDDERIPYDTLPGESYMFAGQGYRNLYGGDSPIQQLYHGVARQHVPAGTFVPPRHAVILFTDAPYIDADVKEAQTLPELS